MSDDPSRYVCGVEKPIPWIPVLATGLLGGVILTALLSWGFVTGTLPLLEEDHRRPARLLNLPRRPLAR